MSTTVQLPETGFLRINQIIGDATTEPPILPIIPVCKSAWWAGVRNGKYPKSIKLTPGTTVWRVEDIKALVKKISETEDADQAA
ncbi:MAG: transcriptional regulator [Candidatus Thiodiazotropha endolucinida]